jgi:adenosylmethionine-8-amino-7-oxononanoate aminotransferase
VLDRGEGVHVWDTQGRRYLDAIAGIAVVNVGYGRREVADALREQALRLPFAVSNTFINNPARNLAAAIAALTPGDLDYIIFTSGGSEAVEVALKLARQYHVEMGDPKRDVIISRYTSYHGASLGALSATGSSGRRRKFEPLLLGFPHIPPNYCYRCPLGLTYPTCKVACAQELEKAVLKVGPERVAAFIAEPIVASAGGAIPPQKEYFPQIRQICDRYGILLIVDEVVTGFGRTGELFGINNWGVIPDLMVMGKGVSGGYAPLGAVAMRQHVREAFVRTGASFDHIFTFAANPLAMAVGSTVLGIFQREQLLQNVRNLASRFREALERLGRYPFVGDVRCTGYMGGIEFVQDKASRQPWPAAKGVAALVQRIGLQNGIVTYPGTGMADGTNGDVISLYPPLTFSEEHLEEMSGLLEATFDQVAEHLRRDLAVGNPARA